MEEPSLKVAKWTDWFNLLERRGKSGMGSGLILQPAQNGMIGAFSRVKGRLDIGADWRDRHLAASSVLFCLPKKRQRGVDRAGSAG